MKNFILEEIEFKLHKFIIIDHSVQEKT